MDKALHPWDDIDRLYVSGKKEGEDIPVSKIVSIHWSKRSNIALTVQRKINYSVHKQYR